MNRRIVENFSKEAAVVNGTSGSAAAGARTGAEACGFLSGLGAALAALWVLAMAAQMQAGQNQWTRNSVGGDVETIAIDPTNPNTLYATHWLYGAVFRSEDGGGRWKNLGEIDPEADRVHEGLRMIADPSVSQTLYLIDESLSSADPAKLLKSTDGGSTWTVLNSGGWPLGLAVNPLNNHILYLAGNGLLKSADGGESWRNIGGTQMPTTTAVALDPASPAVLYVGVQDGPTYRGIYKSVDSGASWKPANKGLPNNGRGLCVGILAVSPSGTVYAATSRGVFKTVDSGAEWTRADAGMPGSSHVTRLLPARRDTQTLFAVSQGRIYRSTDGGRKWRAKHIEGASVGSVTELQIDPDSSSTAYACVRELGVLKTTDGGETWATLGTGLPGPSASLVLPNPTRKGTIYAAASADQGGRHPGYLRTANLVMKSTASGSSWGLASRGLPPDNADPAVFALGVTDLVMNPAHTRILFASTSAGVYRSINGGSSWTPVNTGLSQVRLYGTGPLAIDPANPDRLVVLVPRQGFFETLDAGNQWHLLGTEFAGQEVTVKSLVIGPRNTDVLFAGVVPNNQLEPVFVSRSPDGGRSWGQVGSPIPLPTGVADIPNIFQIAFDAGDPSAIYAATSSGLFRKALGDEDWTRMGPRGGATSVAFDSANPSKMYIGVVGGGVFRSKDGGTTWRAMNDGLATKAVYGAMYVQMIAVDPFDPDRLYAATGDGVYEYTISKYSALE